MNEDLTERQLKKKAIEAAEESTYITGVGGDESSRWGSLEFYYDPHLSVHSDSFLEDVLELGLYPTGIFSDCIYLQPFWKTTKEVQTTKEVEVYGLQ